jgi:hypothetical protein
VSDYGQLRGGFIHFLPYFSNFFLLHLFFLLPSLVSSTTFLLASSSSSYQVILLLSIQSAPEKEGLSIREEDGQT